MWQGKQRQLAVNSKQKHIDLLLREGPVQLGGHI